MSCINFPDIKNEFGHEAYLFPPLTLKSRVRSDTPDFIDSGYDFLYLQWAPVIPSEDNLVLAKPPESIHIQVKCCKYFLAFMVTRTIKKGSVTKRYTTQADWFNGQEYGFLPRMFDPEKYLSYGFPYSTLMFDGFALVDFFVRFEDSLSDGLLTEFYFKLRDLTDGTIEPEDAIYCSGICGFQNETFPQGFDSLFENNYRNFQEVVIEAIFGGAVAVAEILNGTIPGVVWWLDVGPPAIVYRISIPENPLAISDITVAAFVHYRSHCLIDNDIAIEFEANSLLDCVSVILPEPDQNLEYPSEEFEDFPYILGVRYTKATTGEYVDGYFGAPAGDLDTVMSQLANMKGWYETESPGVSCGSETTHFLSTTGIETAFFSTRVDQIGCPNSADNLDRVGASDRYDIYLARVAYDSIIEEEPLTTITIPVIRSSNGPDDAPNQSPDLPPDEPSTGRSLWRVRVTFQIGYTHTFGAVAIHLNSITSETVCVEDRSELYEFAVTWILNLTLSGPLWNTEYEKLGPC